MVALRKESVDRNTNPGSTSLTFPGVALRKESVDRNDFPVVPVELTTLSLSARRAWIEINNLPIKYVKYLVALRKESVDRNIGCVDRAIDIIEVALRKESVDRNSRPLRAAEN